MDLERESPAPDESESNSSNLDNSVAVLEAVKDRLNVFRTRQTKRRLIILHHLSDSNDLAEGHSCRNKIDLGAQHRRFVKALGPFHSARRQLDEMVYRKRVILPVISRLQPPKLSRKLVERLEHLLCNGALPINPNGGIGISMMDGSCAKTKIKSLTRITSSRSLTDASSDDGRGALSVPSQAGNNSDTRDPADLMIKNYTGSSTFLKGTQSANPHNDYSQHFVDTGERPQNFIRDTGLRNRFEEYPKLRELIRLKDELIQSRATPPMYLQADLKTFDLTKLQSKFDVVLIEPPLEEYNRMHGAMFDQHWTWDEVERLEIEQIVAPRSFVWIWCGSGEGLDAARKCLRKWGFRRCEDICWIKTNCGGPGHEALEPGAVFQRTKEHCLMGIHGTVRRSTDGDFIHANIDIDLIIEEAPKYGGYAAKDKPTEIFHIIEHFCLGRRRLHLFGRDSTLRAGWLTVGSELSASNFDARLYASNFSKEPNGLLLGSTEEIERLRPKSPPPRHPNQASAVGVPTGLDNSSGSGVDCANQIGFVPSGAPSVPGHLGNLLHPMSIASSVGGANPSTIPSLLSGASGSLGRHVGNQRGSKSGVLQPSLLGLPSSLPLGASSNISRGSLSTFSRPLSATVRDTMRSTHNSLATPLMTAASASRSLAALQAVVNAQQAVLHSNLFPPMPALWPPSNLAMALAAAAAATGSPALPSSSSSIPSQVGTPVRTPLSDSPLISSLLAAGKLSPAMLAALSSTNVSSPLGLASLANTMRGLNHDMSAPNSRHHHAGGGWH
ncbi:unnamed protein product [Calicophoron daubneyi]|uniref:N(6)-adenosine-methyltransferase non-catalytic subunit METTL14 n=1 Tax=Calicophoron daubneyi TaxID=300641 RepID=A0AAV2TUF3_CALDB